MGPPEIFAATLEWAETRRSLATACGAVPIVRVIERIREFQLRPPAAEPQACLWAVFAFRSIVESVEHAEALCRAFPQALPQAVTLAAGICEWEVPGTLAAAEEFLARQAAVHRDILAIIRRDIRAS